MTSFKAIPELPYYPSLVHCKQGEKGAASFQRDHAKFYFFPILEVKHALGTQQEPEDAASQADIC